MLVDFHMHTTYSDGKMTPMALAQMAKNKNISVIAITDHDEVGAFLELGRYPLEGVTVIPGIEFSSTYYDEDVHILGYNFDITNKRLLDYVHFFKEERRTRIIKMIRLCQENGYAVTYEDLLARFGEGKSLGRPHLAQLLMAKGFIHSINEAFATLLSHKGPCYVPKFKAHPQDVLDIIKEAGGISVLAHPLLIHNDRYVEELINMGFDGIEVYHSRHDGRDEGRYLDMARRYSLLITGGSDYHALPGRFPSELGEYEIQAEQVKSFLEVLNIPKG